MKDLTIRSMPALLVTGLTGATTPVRIVGGTASGAPVTGTFSVNDVVVAANGTLFICTVAGTPGTWVQVSGAGGGGSFAPEALFWMGGF